MAEKLITARESIALLRAFQWSDLPDRPDPRDFRTFYAIAEKARKIPQSYWYSTLAAREPRARRLPLPFAVPAFREAGPILQALIALDPWGSTPGRTDSATTALAALVVATHAPGPIPAPPERQSGAAGAVIPLDRRECDLLRAVAPEEDWPARARAAIAVGIPRALALYTADPDRVSARIVQLTHTRGRREHTVRVSCDVESLRQSVPEALWELASSRREGIQGRATTPERAALVLALAGIA